MKTWICTVNVFVHGAWNYCKVLVTEWSDNCYAHLHSDDGVDEEEHDNQQSYVRQRLHSTAADTEITLSMFTIIM